MACKVDCAVLVFERGSGGHVGFAIGQDDTHFFVLGGNQSDAVTIARIAKSRLLGARWPAILALVRQILTVAGTALVAKGYVQASDIEPVIGALLTIGSVIWSIADKRGR